MNTTGYGLEPGKVAWLSWNYEYFFAPLVGKAIKLLELGIYQGASLRFWRDYFENAIIVGLDYNAVKIDDPTGLIHMYQGYQQDVNLLDLIVKEQAPDGFDVIIDDCSHIGNLARISFWHLFQNHLKPGGLYAIEDWGTGYYPYDKWPDGRAYKPKSQLIHYTLADKVRLLRDRIIIKLRRGLLRAFPGSPKLSMIPERLFVPTEIPSHTHGMVGFVKELLDACHLGKMAIPRSGSGRYLEYGIRRLYISAGVIIVEKAA